MTGDHPTGRDLLREAEGPVPVMLAVTVLVQVLGALDKRRLPPLFSGHWTVDDHADVLPLSKPSEKIDPQARR